jgi:hypothetical protein
MPRLTHALRPAEQTCCFSGRLAVLLRSWDAVADAEGCRAAHHLPYHAKRKAMVMMQSDAVQGPGSATGPLESRPDLAVPAAGAPQASGRLISRTWAPGGLCIVKRLARRRWVFGLDRGHRVWAELATGRG